MKSGIVKFYNVEQEFGFIYVGGGKKDILVKSSEIRKAGMRILVEGQQIIFDIGVDKKSGEQMAVNLKLGGLEHTGEIRKGQHRKYKTLHKNLASARSGASAKPQPRF